MTRYARSARHPRGGRQAPERRQRDKAQRVRGRSECQCQCRHQVHKARTPARPALQANMSGSVGRLRKNGASGRGATVSSAQCPRHLLRDCRQAQARGTAAPGQSARPAQGRQRAAQRCAKGAGWPTHRASPAGPGLARPGWAGPPGATSRTTVQQKATDTQRVAAAAPGCAMAARCGHRGESV